MFLPNTGADDGILLAQAGGYLLESAATSVTEESEENNSTIGTVTVARDNVVGGGWLGGIGALASSLRETAGGMVKVVKTCAINVAAEIALLENEECLGLDGNGELLRLPWEIQNEETGEFYDDDDLKQKIVLLSQEERHFFEPYTTSSSNYSKRNSANDTESDDDDDEFVLDEARVHVIRQLLTLDPLLSAMHARISGRKDVREVTFWRNYFHACDKAREDHVDDLEVEADPVLEVSSQKSLASQRSLNSLVPDEDLAVYNKCDDAPISPASAADDSSYVCLSMGRNSPVGSIKSSRSAGSIVLVDAPRQSSFLDFFTGN